MKTPAAFVAMAILATLSRALDPVAPLGDRMSFEEVGLTETCFADTSGTSRAAAMNSSKAPATVLSSVKRSETSTP